MYDVGGAHVCADKSNDEYEGGAHTVHSCIGRGSCSAIIYNTNWGGSLGHVRPFVAVFFYPVFDAKLKTQISMWNLMVSL